MKKLFSALVIAALALSGPALAKEWDKIRIGVEGAFPPFSYVDEQGELQGFDIDIARALCKQMEAECVLVPQDWDGIIPALLARKYDAIIASMSITDERKKTVDFTNKYYQTPARFVGPKDMEVEITKEGLEGKTVGVQRATTQDRYLTDVYGDTVDIKRYGSQDEAYLDLQAGRVDLLLADSVAIQEGFLNTEAGEGFEFKGQPLTSKQWFGEGAGIAVRKQDDELREQFNQAIRAIREDGTYQQIQDKYFDFDVYGEES